jgi:regulator of RNase E activity RraB
VIFAGEWEMYVGRSESGPVYVTFDVSVATARELPDLPHCVRVMFRVQKPGPLGIPLQEEAERLMALENDLCAALGAAGVLCRLVARLAHGGVWESVFMVGDLGSFQQVLESWWKQRPELKLHFSTHPGWQFYDTAVRPSQAQWQWIRERRVVDALVRRGSDPRKEHVLQFFFLGPPGPLQQLEAELRTRGYEPGLSDVAQGKLVMVLKAPLDVDLIAGQSLALADLCKPLGVTYDGWGAGVVK